MRYAGYLVVDTDTFGGLIEISQAAKIVVKLCNKWLLQNTDLPFFASVINQFGLDGEHDAYFYIPPHSTNSFFMTYRTLHGGGSSDRLSAPDRRWFVHTRRARGSALGKR